VPVFVDTNVLVYARDASEPDKQPRAREWMDALWRGRAGRLSTQVLNEFYVVTTRKLSPGLGVAAARDDVRDLMAWRPLATDGSLMEAAWSVQDRYAVSFWDSLVVAAAIRLSCEYLLSEDLQDGHAFGQTTVVDPFRHRPDDLDL
jgi:predicted nucleic acid-binding protein